MKPPVALASSPRTLRFYHVASSPGSPLPHLLVGKLVGCSAMTPARSCPVRARERVFVAILINPRVRKMRNEASS